MKKKFFDIKKISELVKKNLLIVLFVVFICLGVSLSAYLGSDAPDSDKHWSEAITHVPSTPTPALVPETGWWNTIATPTAKK
jgi:hypothetical protein